MNARLQTHVFSTYLTLRYGIVVIGALLPLIVYVIGAFHSIPLQPSISSYYWAPGGQYAPSRDWFVGCLFAVAAFLYLYKGFSPAENYALNLAALLALGVAVFPMEWDCDTNCATFSIHGVCAVAMFACLVYVVWFRAGDTLYLLTGDASPRRTRFRRAYKIVGTVMLASPLTAFAMNTLTGPHTSYIFFIELAGIWAFALYWWIKSSELKLSAATAQALRGEAPSPPRTSTGPLTQLSSPIETSSQNGTLRG